MAQWRQWLGKVSWVFTPAVIPWVVAFVVVGLAFWGGQALWDYTNSPSFCGGTCHTMPPEYETFADSPHANVLCVQCHVGEDGFGPQVVHKIRELSKVVATLRGSYELPVYTRTLPPAEETCEDCHRATTFRPLVYKEFTHYASDEQNTRTVNRLILKTGSGREDKGVGPFIHWHGTGEVWYLSTDALDQEIPYVRVVLPDGSMREFYDVSMGYTPDMVGGTVIRRMDCTTCHNRVAHPSRFAEDVVDQALSLGKLPVEVPYLRREAVEVLTPNNYGSTEEALAAIDRFPEQYRERHPELYGAYREALGQAVEVLRDLYLRNYYVEQQYLPEAHPDNLGHRRWAGCFRCHDGKHVTQTGDQVIPYACDTCHTIPVQDQNVLRLDGEKSPVSHTNPFWLSLHGRVVDGGCAECHPPASDEVDYTQLEGKPPADGSFCGNPLCHQTSWDYAGWDASAMKPVLERALDRMLHTSPFLVPGQPLTYADPFKAIFEGRCVGCHGAQEVKGGLDLSTYEGVLKGGHEGPGIVPGDPASSVIYRKQTQASPHFGQMTDDEIEALREWILAGAPEK